MKKLTITILLALSLNANAADQQSNPYNPHSYGAPQLYYSHEARREREEQELLKESNRLAKERLEVERERLREERESYDEKYSR
ncbi:MAG TPA: hypothetical protein VIE65_20520 [Methylobacter sp.]|jgi:hypothetical protein